MSTPQKSVLIIGGGLSGTFMAAESLLAGHEVTLIDEPRADSPTQVAAGLFNLITGRKAVLTWRAHELLGALHDFFEQPQFTALKKHLYKWPIYRPFKNPGEYNDWCAKSMQADYESIVNIISSPRTPEMIYNEDGGMEIHQCGWLETAPFVEEALALMETELGLTLHRTRFEVNSFDPVGAKANIGGLEFVYDEVIFTEGTALLHNPLWNWLGIRPLKGQILEVEIEDWDPGYVLLRKMFFLPKGNNFYTVGSTYETEYSVTGPTQEGIAEISRGIKAAVKMPFRVVEARAGMRPTTPNQRPVWGQHPEHPRLFVLNGMGAKGVLQAPWSAKKMRAWLDREETDTPKETGVERFLKKNV
jgi:glycine/D-amino acid oxidase-like deaminating enzyme